MGRGGRWVRFSLAVAAVPLTLTGAVHAHAAEPCADNPTFSETAAGPTETPCPADHTPLGPTSDDGDDGFGTGKAIGLTAVAIALIAGGGYLRRRAHGDEG